MSTRGDMVESPPVIWYQIPRIEPVEQRESIRTREMSLPEPLELPSRSVPDWKEGHIESSPRRSEMRFDHAGSIRGEGGVAGKEARNMFSIK